MSLILILILILLMDRSDPFPFAPIQRPLSLYRSFRVSRLQYPLVSPQPSLPPLQLTFTPVVLQFDFGGFYIQHNTLMSQNYKQHSNLTRVCDPQTTMISSRQYLIWSSFVL